MSNQSLSNFSCASRDTLSIAHWSVSQPFPDFDPSTVANGYYIATTMLVFFLIGSPLNTVVIGIIIKKRLFTHPLLMLMLNLAISNLLACLLVMPFTIVSGMAGEYLFGRSDLVRCRVCKTGVMVTILPLISSCTVALMSVDRLIYLKKPLTYDLIVTPKIMMAAIIVVWILSTAISIPPVFGFGEVDFSHVLATCAPFGDGGNPRNLSYFVILTALGFTPTAVQFVMYGWIICITRKQLIGKLQRGMVAHGSLTNTDPSEGTSDRRSDLLKEYSKSQLQLVKVFGLIFAAGVLTLVPAVIVGFIGAALQLRHGGGMSSVTFSTSTAYILLLSRAVIFPILEVCLTHKIRSTIMMQLLKCKINLQSCYTKMNKTRTDPAMI